MKGDFEAHWKAQREAERLKIAIDDATDEIWRVSAETPEGEAGKYAKGIDVGLAKPRIGMSSFHTLAVEVVTAMDGEGPYLLGEQRLRRIVAALNAVRGIPIEELEMSTTSGDGRLREPQLRFRNLAACAERALARLRLPRGGR